MRKFALAAIFVAVSCTVKLYPTINLPVTPDPDSGPDCYAIDAEGCVAACLDPVDGSTPVPFAGTTVYVICGPSDSD